MFINIHSKGVYPANALSNFASHKFSFDGVINIPCMESFLQSLKFEDPFDQNRVLFLSAREAKLEGSKKKWKKYLYWKGARFNRFSCKYFDFILSAYRQLYQNNDFKTALISTGNKLLLHTIGCTFRKNTVLTWWEFTYILSKLRRESRL